jgi:hypothetical protein
MNVRFGIGTSEVGANYCCTLTGRVAISGHSCMQLSSPRLETDARHIAEEERDVNSVLTT